MTDKIKVLISKIKYLHSLLDARYKRSGRLYEADLTRIICKDLYEEAEGDIDNVKDFCRELNFHKENMLAELSTPELENKEVH